MAAKTKQNVLEYMIAKTEELLADASEEKLNQCTTMAIGEHLYLSRNLTSLYLNELVKEGSLIKIASRPVYFLCRQEIEKVIGDMVEELDSYNGKEFLEMLKGGKRKSIFEQMIGSDGSLAYCIEQCKSALKYPKCGLPIMLVGDAGTGKRMLAQLLYQYGIVEKVLEKDAVFAVLECGELEKTAEGGAREIFGSWAVQNSKKVFIPGLLETTRNGVLLLRNAEGLGSKCQEKLAEFLKNRAYSLPSRNREKRTSNTRIIFSVIPEQRAMLRKTLISQIPVVSEIPSLQNRGPEDKEKLIVKFFRDEEIELKRNIRISDQAFEVLRDAVFPDNISQLKNSIRVTCANAFFNQEEKKTISVLLYHLPDFMIEQSQADSLKDKATFMDLNAFVTPEPVKRIILYYSQILNEFDKWKSQKISIKEFISQSTSYMNQYYDYLIYEQKYDNKKVKALESVIQKLLKNVGEKHDIFLPLQCSYVLARNIYKLANLDSELTGWEQGHLTKIQECISVLESEYTVESRIANELREALEILFHMKLNQMNFIFLVLNIRFYNHRIYKDKTVALIMTIGYQTAGAIADTVNRLLGKHVFESVNLAPECSKEDMISAVSDRIRSEAFCKRMFLFTDMEYGKETALAVADRFQIETGYLNQTNTMTVLEVGRGIKAGVCLQKIFDLIEKKSTFKYEFFRQNNKQPAILFTSESGEVVTQRIIQMFEESILRKKNIYLASYDAAVLTSNEWKEIGEKYEVLFVLGTQNPGIENASFIPLEDIISFENLDEMNKILKKYLNEAEIRTFNDELMNNFTLQNVVSQLTILDANTLMEYIGQSLKMLQGELGLRFSPGATIGISIHLACMVERLVTKMEIEGSERAKKFRVENGAFIECMKRSFRELTEHYHISLPDSEILYVYDYIRNDNVTKELPV